MTAMNPGWYNRNSQRKYPLQDTSGGIGRDGKFLPESFLLDVSLYVPESAGVTNVYVGSASRSVQLLSVVIIGSTPSGPLALGAATTTVAGNPQPSAVLPLSGGVRGYVVFGNTAVDQFNVVFDDPDAAALLPGTWTRYQAPPLAAVRADGRTAALRGDVKLRAAGNLEVIQADVPWSGTANYDANPRQQRVVHGEQVPGIVLRLNPSLPERTLMSYLGVCVTDTQSACDPPVFQTINDVGPDADGNITIEIVGIPLKDLIDASGAVAGVVLESPLGITDVCAPGADLTLPPLVEPDCEDDTNG